MSTTAAENHLKWRVKIGYGTTGYGCLVHPRIVLTSTNAGPDDEGGTVYRHSFERFNTGPATSYSVGHVDEERSLAALVLENDFRDPADGKLPASYPEIASEPPMPGQALSVLTSQWLIGGHGDNWDVSPRARGSFLCFSFGYVSLLRSKDKLLYALSGILTDDDYAGGAVFDQNGKIFGVVTGFLKHYCDPTRRDATRGAGRFIVFSPVFNSRTQLLQLASNNGRNG